MIKPKPTQSESPFGFDEFFFSTTDERGVIRFGNDIFIRISGYPKDVMLGAPHSIIRHPDMPRAVFKLFWDTIKAGNPIAAYVKNMSANGNYYWVLAFAFPIEDGYLSIRFKPSSELFKAAQKIYASTLEVESTSGMEASFLYLVEQIQQAGFPDYTNFMIKAAFAEINILQGKIKDTLQVNSSGITGEISNISHSASEKLKDCFRRIQSFQTINKSFVDKIELLNQNFQHLKFIALNMTIAAAKFGEQASSLGVVAKEFSELAEQIRSHLAGLSDFIALLSSVVQKCALKIVALESQMMMVDFFVKESLQKLNSSENAFAGMIENRVHFSGLFKKCSAGLSSEIDSLKHHLNDISEKMGDVRKFTTGLEVIRQIGAVESSRMNETKQTFMHYLEEMKKFINLLQTSGGAIQSELDELQTSCQVIRSIANELSGLVDSIFDLAASYSSQDQSSLSTMSIK